jgi:predicted porin
MKNYPMTTTLKGVSHQNVFAMPYGATGNWGILLPHAGDLDNTGIDYRVNNAVRYVSPSFAGVSLGAL